jgi:16S rRNA C1402 N4-methylase RsmH
MWTDWEKKANPNATIPRHLLWDMKYDEYDWERGKNLVVERVIERGREQDFYTIFRMYGGVEGVREIAKNIKHFRWKQDAAFVEMVFDIKKEDMVCYERKRLRDQLLNS